MKNKKVSFVKRVLNAVVTDGEMDFDAICKEVFDYAYTSCGNTKNGRTMKKTMLNKVRDSTPAVVRMGADNGHFIIPLRLPCISNPNKLGKKRGLKVAGPEDSDLIYEEYMYKQNLGASHSCAATKYVDRAVQLALFSVEKLELKQNN